MPSKKKQAEQQEPDPVMTGPPTVEVNGKTYTMRRLGMRDVFRLARILGNGVAVLGDTEGRYSPAQMMQVLVASMARNEDEVLALLADLLDVKRAALSDPEHFPMESIVDILRTLSEHQDLRAFFDRLGSLMDSLPEMQQTQSEEPSTS